MAQGEIGLLSGGIDLLLQRLPDLDDMAVEIIEAKHSLPPNLALQGMDERDAILKPGKALVDVVVFEIEEKIAPAKTAGFWRSV